jgi:hypothetical protein
VLGDEVGQPARPDAGLGVQLRVLDVRRDESSASSSGRAQQPDGLAQQHRHRRRLAVERLGHRGHRLVGLGGVQPSASTPWRTWSCQPPTSTPAEPSAADTGPIRSRSSSTRRSAPFLPMPGTRVSAAMSPPEMARRTASGWCTASTAWASRGPTPLAVCSSSNSCFSSSSANP